MKLVLPIPPKPQSRPRFDPRKKRAYEERAMTDYKKTIAYYAFAAKSKKIEKGAVSINVCFYIYPPKYVSKVKKNIPLIEQEVIYCNKLPDLDNYYKAVTDAVNGIMYKDDGQIAVMICRKVYSFNPRTEIEVEELG